MSKLIEVDTKTFIRFWLVIVALFVAGLFLWQARTGLVIVGLSVFLAIALKPFTDKIQKITRKKLGKGASAGFAVGLIVTVLVLFLATVGPLVINESVKFFSNAPELIESSGSLRQLDTLGARFGIASLSSEILTMIKGVSAEIVNGITGSFISSVSNLASFITSLILVLVLTVLCLTQGPGLANKFWRKIEGKNGKTGEVSRRITQRIASVISKYVGGQATVALVDGIVVGIATFILSLIFGFSSGLAFPMAMISAIFVLIPMFGQVIAALLVSLMLFFQTPIAGLVYLIFFIIYAQIENNIISPKIQANSLKLPSLIILIAITIGMYTFGLLGAIISIPIAGIIKVLIEEYPAIRALEQKNAS